MKKFQIKGFGLIEVLIAMFILAGGLLAIASFQGSLINESSDSKNKARATMIAQERIEQMRNYTKLAYNEGDFDDIFPPSNELTNDTTIQGLSANFLRQEKIENEDGVKNIQVQVSWESATGVTEAVTVDSKIIWQPPGLSAKLDDSSATGPLVRSATGRARLGKGQVSDGETINKVNGDTTGLVDRGDGDLRLTSGNDVVLTLEDACEIENNARTSKPCTGFVEISGTVYIDRDTTDTPISDFYVIASDAAYCQRYWIDESESNEEDKIKAISAETSQAEVTENGDYEFFYYTCYLGGGWHGNIGILADGPEWACLGDPTSINSFEQPAVAIRRVYRGMAFNYEDDGVTKVTDDNNDTIYYSIGVADALILPEEGEAGHDFVLAGLSSSESSACITDTGDGNNITEAPMLKSDAIIDGVEGGLFEGVPSDFFCLNQNPDWVDQVKLESYGYATDPYCPFDPSDPPSTTHSILGKIAVSASAENAVKIAEFDVLTSDGYGNCTKTDYSLHGSFYEVDYQCNVYDWGNGWNGYIQITPDLTTFTCDTTIKSLSSVTSDANLQAFHCYDNVEDIGVGNVTITGNISITAGALDSITLDGAACDIENFTYTCNGENFELTEKWEGIVGYTPGQHKVCFRNTSNSTGATIELSEGANYSQAAITNSSNGSININIEITNGNCN